MKSLLSQGSWWVLNKKFTQKYGIETSILLTDLVTRYEYWLGTEKLIDGFFFCPKDEIQKDTTLSHFKQNKALEELENLGIVETERKGFDPKTFYKVNIEVLNKIIYELYKK